METVPDPIGPALVTVRLKFGQMARRHPSAVYAIYVDGRALGTTPHGSGSAVVVPEGSHTVHVKIGHMMSDVVALGLAAGDRVDLLCDQKPVMQSKFARLVQTKALLFLMPLALVARAAAPPEIARRGLDHARDGGAFARAPCPRCFRHRSLARPAAA